LTYDTRGSADSCPGGAEDAAEEYDPPETIDALASAIERLGHQAVRLGGGAEFLANVPSASIDFVFNIAEGRGTYRSREAQVPSVLEMLGVPYSGSDPLTLAICLDKPFAKRVASAAGVHTPRHCVVEHLDALPALQDDTLTFPVVVKPTFEGSSKGIRLSSRVERWEGLRAPVQTILEVYGQPALVEEFIPGTEITVGLVGNSPPRVVGVMEVVPQTGTDGNFMYTLEVKRNWRQLVFYRSPPDLPGPCVQEIEHVALKLFRELGCRDLARLDFRIDRDNHPYFLEANPLPGLGGNSDLPIMAELSGWSYTQLIQTILNAALQRNGLGDPQNAHRACV
jgi:D-alanine-D-alanine ligase